MTFKIIDLFEVVTGTTPSTKQKEYWENGSINWITPTDMSKLNGKIYIKESERKITEKALKTTNLTLLPKSAVIISTRAPVGYVSVLLERATFNQGCKGLIPKNFNIIYPEFYYYYILSKKRDLESQSSGSTFKELSKDTLERFPIPLPPLPEQRRIAEVLGTVDSAIQKVGGAIERTERLKMGLMQRLLTRGLGHERFKFSKELGCEIPEEWVVTQIKEVVVSYKNGIYKPNEFYGIGYPSIRMYNIRHGRINNIKAPLLQVNKQELEDYGLEEGDILINRVNTAELVGRAGVVPRGLGKITFESKNIRVRLNTTKVIPDFFSVYVQTAIYAKQIRSKAKVAVAQATITQEDIDNVIFPLPPLPEQRRIAEILSAADRKLELERRRKENGEGEERADE